MHRLYVVQVMYVTMKKSILILLVALVIVTCEGQQLGSCKIVRNKAIQHVYHTISAVSSVDCCRACSLNGSCVAINYEESTGTCGLNNENPYVGGNQERVLFLVPWCKDPWIEYMDSCYTRSPDRMSWMDAEEHCVSLGGHLADIYVQGENTFIAKLAVSGLKAWIGLADIWNSKPWRWSTGIALIYNNFNGNEPNGEGRMEECVEVYTSGAWNDQECSDHNHAICKKPLI